jgi:hypothetical protein
VSRKGLSKRLRFEVFKRDLFTCQYCGRRPPEVMLHADHVVPVVEGGSDDPSNLTTSCVDCNQGKAGVSLGRVAPALNESERFEAIQEMMERKAVLSAEIAANRAHKDTQAEAVELVRSWWDEAVGADEDFEPASVRVFLARMSLAELRECADAAAYLMSKKPWTKPRAAWKYFCGTAWKIIKGNEPL